MRHSRVHDSDSNLYETQSKQRLGQLVDCDVMGIFTDSQFLSGIETGKNQQSAREEGLLIAIISVNGLKLARMRAYSFCDPDEEAQCQQLRRSLDEATAHGDHSPGGYRARQKQYRGNLGKNETGGNLHGHVTNEQDQAGCVPKDQLWRKRAEGLIATLTRHCCTSQGRSRDP